MSDRKAVLRYLLDVHANPDKYSNEELDTKLYEFCELLQAQINHPFAPDGMPDVDTKEVRWRMWRDEHGVEFVLNQLMRDDVWTYLIPNIVVTKEYDVFSKK